MRPIKPILFNSEMVRAILDGRKKQTRRIVKVHSSFSDDRFEYFPCSEPPFLTDDLLYVRETWFYDSFLHQYLYRASDPHVTGYDFRWKPSIFMPKEAARIFLRITDFRIEPLQDITINDIALEGVSSVYSDISLGFSDRAKFINLWNSTVKKSNLDRYGWNANPWVWVYNFERVGYQNV